MAYLATQRRPGTSAPGDGSRTITITPTPANEADGTNPNDTDGSAPIIGALHLRGGVRRTRQRVAWDEDVVDNEGCGRKSSKICCIYHKPKDFDESSSEDDSSSDEDSDSSLDDGRARPRRGSNHHHHPHPHPHPDGGAGAAQRDPQIAGVTEFEEAAEPNAYEMVPSSGKKGKGKRKSIG